MLLKVILLSVALLVNIGVIAFLVRVFQKFLESSGILELMNEAFYRLVGRFSHHKPGRVAR